MQIIFDSLSPNLSSSRSLCKLCRKENHGFYGKSYISCSNCPFLPLLIVPCSQWGFYQKFFADFNRNYPTDRRQDKEASHETQPCFWLSGLSGPIQQDSELPTESKTSTLISSVSPRGLLDLIVIQPKSTGILQQNNSCPKYVFTVLFLSLALFPLPNTIAVSSFGRLLLGSADTGVRAVLV